jgi:hypothetical protein
VSTLRSEKLRILEEEMARANIMIREFLLAGDRLLALGTVVISGGLTIGATQDQTGVLVALPLPLIVLLIYWFSQQVEISAQGGYKQHLEEEINRLLGEKVLHWDRHVAKKVSRRLPTRTWLIQGALFLVFVVVSGVSVWAANEDEMAGVELLPEAVSVLLGAAVIALAVGVWDAGRAFRMAYCLARWESGYDDCDDEAVEETPPSGGKDRGKTTPL